ncbi:MAG TPA: hypothetical protein VLV78_04995 [Thermoanaerobaculia bacterium]|nr:hypothetical protein [Thermoanaerobaculia bacterium]
MRRSRRDLVIPVRDRRQRRRILTLKNFGYAVAALVAIFAGITIEANLRGRKPHQDFGRLYDRQLDSKAAVQKKPEIVQEAPISDQTAPDPMLVDAMAREQFLRVEQPVASAPQPAATESRIVVTGGPEGVNLVQSDRPKPVLHGGFGR